MAPAILGASADPAAGIRDRGSDGGRGDAANLTGCGRAAMISPRNRVLWWVGLPWFCRWLQPVALRRRRWHGPERQQRSRSCCSASSSWMLCWLGARCGESWRRYLSSCGCREGARDRSRYGSRTLDWSKKVLRVGVAFPPGIESSDEDTCVRSLLPAGEHDMRDPGPLRRMASRILRFGRPVTLQTASPSLSVSGPFGAVSAARCEIRVYPDLIRDGKRVEPQFLNRGAAGIHRQRQLGRGREFEKLREYTAGDDSGEIHWKATAKRGRPVTKVFQVERTQEVYVIVDASRLTARPAGWARHNPRALRQRRALLFGLAAQRQGDLFGLVTFSDRVHGFARARNGKAHYATCREAPLQSAPASGHTGFRRVVLLPAIAPAAARASDLPDGAGRSNAG